MTRTAHPVLSKSLRAYTALAVMGAQTRMEPVDTGYPHGPWVEVQEFCVFHPDRPVVTAGLCRDCDEVTADAAFGGW